MKVLSADEKQRRINGLIDAIDKMERSKRPISASMICENLGMPHAWLSINKKPELRALYDQALDRMEASGVAIPSEFRDRAGQTRCRRRKPRLVKSQKVAQKDEPESSQKLSETTETTETTKLTFAEMVIDTLEHDRDRLFSEIEDLISELNATLKVLAIKTDRPAPTIRLELLDGLSAARQGGCDG